MCVDLDGTLVRTDTMFECCLQVLRTKPLHIVHLLFWIFAGKARLKHKLAQAAGLQVASLPYADDVLGYIRSQHASGRTLLLVTGADSLIAMPVAQHLGLFSDVICSDGHRNLTGKRKLAAIQSALEGKPFKYAGDSQADLEVWRGAQAAVIIGSDTGMRNAVEQIGISIDKIFPRPRLSLGLVRKARRFHHWVKNILVFVPIVLAHRVLDRHVLVDGIRSFFALSFCSSALYLFNDLLDLPTDRESSRKRSRPLASNELSIPVAFALSGMLLTCSAVLTPIGKAMMILASYAFDFFMAAPPPGSSCRFGN
jgi:phosphoglycolate phosphatase-like HAD superfamily hydrolase